MRPGRTSSGTTLTPQTSIAVASITKTFVAAEVLLLAKAKKVDLDAPLSTYVKHKLTANNATVRQHLAMTSGVPDFLPDDYASLDKALTAAPGGIGRPCRRCRTTPRRSEAEQPVQLQQSQLSSCSAC